MFHPSRGGARGGRDQFNWDDVKNDKDRFNYLGNSLKAAVKKPWDQGPEAGWYDKDGARSQATGKEKAEIMSEIQMIKAKEAEYMASVLSGGFGFKKAAAVPTPPDDTVSEQRPMVSRPGPIVQDQQFTAPRAPLREQARHRSRSQERHSRPRSRSRPRHHRSRSPRSLRDDRNYSESSREYRRRH